MTTIRLSVLCLVATATLSACIPMSPVMTGGVSHGTSPEVCANIKARAANSQNPESRAYAARQLIEIGC